MQLDTTSDLTLDQLRDKEDLTPEESARLATLEDNNRVEILTGLAKKITDNFVKRANDRTVKEHEWIKAGNLYNSPLTNARATPDDPFKPDKRNTRPTPNIVRTKCDTAVATSYSMQFAAGSKNWDLFPPANNMSEAVSIACIQMEKEIDSQLDACNYAAHARKAMEDRVIYGTGILKGPVNTGKRKVEYVQQDGVWIAQPTTDYTPTIVHVPTWRFYPDMSVVEFRDSDDVIETHSWAPITLSQYRNHPGFDSDAITSILTGEQNTPEYCNAQIQTLKEDVWNLNPYLYKKKKYLVLEYHGPVTYDELNAMGIEAEYAEGEEVMEFFGEVWVCAGKVIRMEIENIEGYYETPYAVSVWKKDPGSIFGFGHPLLLADPQRVVTQAYHMILDNAALTSGPQVAMYKKYVQPVDGDWKLQPNKVWHLTDPSKTVNEAIQFFNPTNVIGQIMPVLNLAMQFGEQESATSETAAGLSSPQNVESATGQLIMQHASTTLLDFQSQDWDDEVTEKIIRRFYAWNMQFSKREDIKGNYTVDVKSSSEYKNKQMYVRDLERLSMETAQNPILADVVNMDALTRTRMALMHLPDNRIIRSPEETAQIAAQREEKPDPAMIELELKSREVAVKEKELQLRAANLQFEQTMVQRREEMDFQEKMGSNEARLMEAQARVLEVQGNERIELLKLAQKGEMHQQQLQAVMQQSMDQTQSKVFVASMQNSTKAREQDLVQQELNVKRDLGTGI